MKEPSILDYLKSWLDADKRIRLREYLALSEKMVRYPEKKKKSKAGLRIRWQVIFGCLLALGAQFLLEPRQRRVPVAIALYAAAGICLWLGYRKKELDEFVPKDAEDQNSFSGEIRLVYFALSMLFLAAAFLLFRDNTFTLINVWLWVSSIFFFILAVWERPTRSPAKRSDQHAKPVFLVLILLVLGISAFYRFYRLGQVPGEMFSDHAEKLLDIMDVLAGKTSIYFTRNTGREALQFYLTAAVIRLFHTGISFLSLKIGTACAGLAALPFIYLLGKQLGNKWVGLTAMLMAGVAYWPNVISRVALRFAFYPLFAAPVLYFLLRGLQNRNRNDLLVSGLLLGLGLHGYSPARILPIYVVLVFILYELHQSRSKKWVNDIWILGLMAFAAFIVFLPLFRYFLENPGLVSYRALSRMTSTEQTIDGSVFLIFLNNLWKSLVMFFYDNGQIWVHSIPHRPALDLVTAAFYFAGTVFEVKKYTRYRRWEDLALLAAVPVLMLPSILSLAFPNENPSLNRSGGAIVPVFLLAAIGFYQCARGIFSKKENTLARSLVAVFLMLVMSLALFQNYDLVFNQYHGQFIANAWNTSEIGQVIAKFAANGNSFDDAYVVPYPHWVDTRLVGINAGVPWKDYALWPEDFESMLGNPGNKLIILKPEDTENLENIRLIAPVGREEIFHSKTAGKDFIIYSITQD